MEHPRIARLRSQVYSLPVDAHYRAVLLQSIEYFRDQIVARPPRARDKGWDNLEALQQAALGGMMERALQEKFSGQAPSPTFVTPSPRKAGRGLE